MAGGLRHSIAEAIVDTLLPSGRSAWHVVVYQTKRGSAGRAKVIVPHDLPENESHFDRYLGALPGVCYPSGHTAGERDLKIRVFHCRLNKAREAGD